MGKKNHQLRQLLIQEAAKVMYEEGVSQYLDAKRIAAKRLCGGRVKSLPSNGEISDEIYRLSQRHEGQQQVQQLYMMRQLALKTMRELEMFSPRLIGSVSTGRIRESSDIDIHLFADSIELVIHRLETLGWYYEVREVCIEQQGRLQQYHHIYLNFDYPVELSIYDTKEIRFRTRSSTDGKSIERLSIGKVTQLIEQMND